MISPCLFHRCGRFRAPARCSRAGAPLVQPGSSGRRPADVPPSAAVRGDGCNLPNGGQRGTTVLNRVNATADFRILGRLEVVVQEHPVSVVAGRQRVLLASLLLRANEIVPIDELIDRLWGASPPRNARP